MDYIAYLHKDPNSDYGVSFPDFPGCITAGKTLQEARRNAQEALELHIAGMVEDGEKIPEPSTLDDVAGDPSRKDALMPLVVNVDSGKRVRINITAKESQIHRIDQMARQAGMTRSAFVVQAAIHVHASQSEPRHRFKKAATKHRPKAVHSSQKHENMQEPGDKKQTRFGKRT